MDFAAGLQAGSKAFGRNHAVDGNRDAAAQPITLAETFPDTRILVVQLIDELSNGLSSNLDLHPSIRELSHRRRNPGGRHGALVRPPARSRAAVQPEPFPFFSRISFNTLGGLMGRSLSLNPVAW